MTNKIEQRHFTPTGLEVRAADDGSKKARGYAVVYNSNSLDLGGWVERVALGAFDRSLSEVAGDQLNVYALWAHDTSMPLASTRSGKLVLTSDDHGLAFEMDVTRMTPMMLDALADGDLQMSFGFNVREQKWVEDSTGKIERTLLDVDLGEISFVVYPAYPATDAALRSLEAWKADQINPQEEVKAQDKELRSMKNNLIARTILARLPK